MRLRSFLGFALVGVALALLMKPVTPLSMLGDLVVTAADNPFSIEAGIMAAVSVAVVIILAVSLIAAIGEHRLRVLPDYRSGRSYSTVRYYRSGFMHPVEHHRIE